MRILLIQSRAESSAHIPVHIPIGLTQLAACVLNRAYLRALFSRIPEGDKKLPGLLEATFEFKILDFQALPDDASLERTIRKFRPDLIGFKTLSASIDHTCSLIRKAAAAARSAGLHPEIMAGGYHATCLPEELFDRAPEVDCAMTSEAEETFPIFLANRLLFADPRDAYRATPGLFYRSASGRLQRNRSWKPVLTLDDYPRQTDQLGLINLNGYARVRESSVAGSFDSRLALLITSRGCPVTCSFCPTFRLYLDRRIRNRSVGHIMTEMEDYYRRGYRVFGFRDDNFTTDRNRIHELCREILVRNLKLAMLCMSRVDTIDFATLELMQKAGLAGIGFGVECADESIMLEHQKHLRLGDVKRVADMCRHLRLPHKFYYMVGLPGQTWRHVVKTALFILYSFDLLAITEEGEEDRLDERFDELVAGLLSSRLLPGDLLRETEHRPWIPPDPANVSYCVPYPGSRLYDDRRIRMIGTQWKHGPAERNNLDAFPSPVVTDDMTADDLSRARSLLVDLIRALHQPERLAETLMAFVDNQKWFGTSRAV